MDYWFGMEEWGLAEKNGCRDIGFIVGFKIVKGLNMMSYIYFWSLDGLEKGKWFLNNFIWFFEDLSNI